MIWTIIAIVVALIGWGLYIYLATKKPSEGLNLNKEGETIATLRAELSATEKERNILSTKVIKFETTSEQKDKELKDALTQIQTARESFEDEKKRVRKADEDIREKASKERDRMWNEHESKVATRMIELCQTPEYQLPIYTNKNIPVELVEVFGARFKPDILIQLENQFVVFDAKHSKSEQLATYISNQVKSFAVKADSNKLIYPAVFFVVPTPALVELKQTTFTEAGYRVYIVGLESLPVLLAMFKRIEGYALADKLDPAERENIVTALATMYQHINFRNATDLLLTKTGWNALRQMGLRLSSDMQNDVNNLLNNSRVPNLSTSETKKLMADPDNQQNEMVEMISPKAMISKKDFDAVEYVKSDTPSQSRPQKSSK